MNEVLARLQQRAWITGGIGLVACLAGAAINLEQFFRSFLLAWVFWVGLAGGCLALLMLQHLTGGGWGFVIRRILEAATRTLPLLAVLAVPLWVGIPKIYEWAHPEHLDPALAHKTVWLNTPFFIGRTAFYLAIWILLAWMLNRWSEEQDRAGNPNLAGRMEALSGPGLVFFGLTATFHAIDWAMTLEPHWFSTLYGLHFIIGQVLLAMAFAVVILRQIHLFEPMAKVVAPSHFHDLGNLMMAFVLVWAYLTFSQFLIIWSGNLPEETPWYLHRIHRGWQVVALALVLFHWAFPFLLLLSRGLKRKPGLLAPLALGMMLMRFVDLFWTIKPAFATEGLSIHWLDLAWMVGLGGVWVGFFCRELRRRPLLPLHDPIGDEIAAAASEAHA